MSSTKVVPSNQNVVLYDIAPGKPDCAKPRPEKGLDSRNRKIQKPASNDLCIYYAFALIRDRIGKNSFAFRNERKIEEICSNWRKQITHLMQGMNPNDAVFEEKYYRTRAIAHREFMKAFGKDPSKEIENHHKKTLKDSFALDPSLASVGIPFDQMVNEIYPLAMDQAIKLKPFLHDQLLENAVTCLMLDKYGLKRSDWIPSEDISPLIEELKKNGPMMIIGSFGEPFYEKQPDLLKNKINEHSIYGWPVGSRRIARSAAHAVVLVGAQKAGEIQQVYFIDPNDESDPANSEPRKIYAISFRNLKENIRSLHGIPIKEMLCSAAIGYAVFNPSFKNIQK